MRPCSRAGRSLDGTGNPFALPGHRDAADRLQCADDALTGWRDDVLTGKPPTLYPIGTGELARVEVGP